MRNHFFFFESDKIYCRFPCNRLLKVHFCVFPFENTFSVSKGWFRVFRPFSAIAENHRPYSYYLYIFRRSKIKRQCIQPHACVFTIQPHACGCIQNPGFWKQPHVWWLHRVKGVQPCFLVNTRSIAWRNKAVSLLTNKKGILYKLLFSRGFYFREFREPDPRENFHFN